MQTNLLEHLALAESLDELPRYIPGALKIFKNEVDKLLSGEICPEDLVMKYRVTRRPEEYKVMTAGARAAKQLIDEGKEVKPGQRVSLLFVNGGNVRAWKSNDTFSPMIIDKNHYRELAVRAAGSVFQPFGIKEEDLMAWTKGGIQIPLKYPNTRGQKRYLINQYADSPGLIRALC
jgi:DNA polymerase elongation subunit (family B)